MKKLKIILQYNWIFYFIVFFSFVYCLIYVNIPKSSKYDITDNKFEGIIDDIFIDGNYLTMVLIGDEKLQSSYYFQSLEEKENFINEYKLGDKILVRGELSIPSNNTNLNLFNYKEYLYHEKIYYTLNIEKYQKISNNTNFLYKLKNCIIERIKKIEHTSSYLYALILGDDRYLSEEYANIYQEIGISHLFAISGMHISILSSILLFVLKKTKCNDILSYLIVMLFLIIYLFITGCSPSILRATILFILLSINKLFKLNIKVFNIFLLTISIIVCIDPFIIYKVGFQFSSIISGALILFSSLINKCKNYFSKLLMTSFISFLLGLPISIYNFYQINILSFIYNLFFVPLMSFLLFPMTLITIIFKELEPILLIIINLLEKVASICSYVPSSLIFKKPTCIIIVLYYVIIFFILKRWKKSKKLLLGLIIILGIHYNYNALFKSNYVVFLDVGQGDSILMHSKGESILIDTGGRIQYSVEKWEKREHSSSLSNSTILPLLKSLGIRSLNYLVLTHGDYDHMGESINIVNNFKVEKVIFNNDGFNSLEQELIKVLDKNNIRYYQNIKELNIDKNTLYFLNDGNYGNENDNSSVIYTEIDEIKLLLTGDAGVEVEEDILKKYNFSDIDILKVGHHGSKTSSGKDFINEINPKYSIISVGKNNRYGHPNDNVLENLENSKIYRTDFDGSILFKIKDNKLKIKTCSP